MLVGYARVSRPEQELNLQLDALEKSECGKIFSDKISGAKSERPGLDGALRYVRSGDILVVWKLDRLGRSLTHLIDTITSLEERGVGFRSLTENIDTTTSSGRLIFHLIGALAEFERNLIRERTMAGLEAARARGRKGGRKKVLSTDKKIQLAQKLYDDRSNDIGFICETLRISRATLYRYIKVSRDGTPTTTTAS